MKKTPPQFDIRRYPDYLTAGYILYMLTAFLLLFGGQGYAAITLAKWRLYLTGSLTYLGLLLLFTVELLVIKKIQLPPLRVILHGFSPAQICATAFLLTAAVSALLSDYPETVWLGCSRREGLATLLLYVTTFLAVCRFGRFRPVYIWCIAGVLLVNALIALAQLAGGNPFGLFPEGLNYYGAFIDYNGAFLGTVGNVDLFSALICLLAPTLICYALQAGNNKARAVLLAVGALSLAVLVYVKVAAGIVAWLGLFCLLGPLLITSQPRRQKYLYLLMALLVLLGLVLIYFLGDRLDGVPAELSSLLHGNVQDSFGSSRIAIWKASWKLAPQHWLLGGGPDTIGQRLALVFSRDLTHQGLRIQTVVDTAHNEYLNLLVNTGLLGMATYLAALLSTAANWLRRRKDAVAFALGAGMLGYCIQAFFCFSQCIVTPVLWLLWGMLEYRLRQLRLCE